MSAAETFADAARSTVGSASEAIAWLQEPVNAARVGNEQTALVKDLRRLRLSAGKLERAAALPMCVGVFGPSQAGKSYLVSVLAKPKDSQPVTMFEGRELDFLRDINPEGGKESTGLVTRFSLTPQRHPPGFPVCLRLLSEADIIKILGNTFFLDGDLKAEQEPEPEQLQILLRKARDAVAASSEPGISEEDVWDIQDYFEKHFAGRPYLRALQPMWDEAASLLPKLSSPARAELLAPLWGGHEAFTRLYRMLAAALAELRHSPEAFCSMDALLPRASSIIDVTTLAGLGKTDAATLAIRTFDGSPVQLPRPVITALVAEIRMVLKESPWPFFAHTDLLDFPGARSRQQVPLQHFFQANAEALKECFLRGKVAYLFDRYVAEQELTSMLLCIADSNQEVVTLPDMVADWITRTHGSTPAERDQRPCVLFVVLTKFDMHFTEKGGADQANPGSRFATRMFASLTGFFGRAHRWPAEWIPGEPFKNCFWLRNPNYPAESIIIYDADKREVEHRSDRQDYLARLRTAYLAVPEIQNHFADPAAAWDEALKLNDGGVGYLADRLAPVCRPEMKLQQLVARLASLRHQMVVALERFYVADDVEARLAQRREVASVIVDDLYRCADFGRFGYLLRAVAVSSTELADLLNRVEVAPELDGQKVRVVQTPVSPGGGRARPGQPRPSAPPAAESTPTPLVLTREQMMANAALRHWMERLHRVAQNTRQCQALALQPTSMAELAVELIGGASRLNLAERMAERIRRSSFIQKAQDSVQQASILLAAAINHYVDYLGYDALPPQQRPQVTGAHGTRPVFQVPVSTHDASGIAAEPNNYADRFIEDWAFAFFRLVEDNATGERGRQVDLVQNARLGKLLDGLRKAVAA